MSIRASSSGESPAGSCSPWLRRAWLALILTLGVGWTSIALAGSAAQSDAEGQTREAPRAVVQMRVAGPLDKGTQSLVRRALDEAEERSGILVVELDTPGGEVELMFQIATQLANAGKRGVTSVAWVHDRAYSAGALVAMACERLYMREQGVIGAAAVVQVSPEGGIVGLGDDEAAEKYRASVRAAFRAFAASHGRPPALAEGMVDRDLGVRQVRTVAGELIVVTARELEERNAAGEKLTLVRTVAERGNLVALSGSEAVLFGMSDGIADSLTQVLEKVGATSAPVVLIERTRSEDLAAWLASVHYLLIGVGVMALMAEIKAPGFGAAGAVAIVCFALALFGNYLVGLADVPHLLAVGIGLVFVAVELFLMPGAIWPGVVGAVLVFGGLAFAQIGPDLLASPFGREIALDNALELCGGTVLAILLGGLLTRFLPRAPLVGGMVQQPTAAFAGGAPGGEFTRTPRVGESGVALTPLRPVGKLRVDGHPEELEARSVGAAVEAGSRVRVIAVEGLRVVVEPEHATRAEPRP